MPEVKLVDKNSEHQLRQIKTVQIVTIKKGLSTILHKYQQPKCITQGTAE